MNDRPKLRLLTIQVRMEPGSPADVPRLALAIQGLEGVVEAKIIARTEVPDTRSRFPKPDPGFY